MNEIYVSVFIYISRFVGGEFIVFVIGIEVVVLGVGI